MKKEHQIERLENIALLPCTTDAGGDHKIRLLAIDKSENPRLFRNISLPVYYRNQKSAWVSCEIFAEWFHKEFISKKNLQSKNLKKKALMLFDNISAYWIGEGLSDDDHISIIFFPPNCTALIQPMDQNGIYNVKVNYRNRLTPTSMIWIEEFQIFCLVLE